jgi:2-methylcitrate dehydratase PrpD
LEVGTMLTTAALARFTSCLGFADLPPDVVIRTRLLGEPADKKIHPANIVDAQFSGPFVIATALATGRMEWDSYRLLEDPAIHALR